MALKDSLQDKTGIYRLGFNPYSFMGILLPLLFVVFALQRYIVRGLTLGAVK